MRVQRLGTKSHTHTVSLTSCDHSPVQDYKNCCLYTILQNCSCLVYLKYTMKFQTLLYETYLTALDCDSVYLNDRAPTIRRDKPEMQAAFASQTTVFVGRTTRCHNPELLNPEDGGRMSL
jgi:hypothetical protein